VRSTEEDIFRGTEEIISGYLSHREEIKQNVECAQNVVGSVKHSPGSPYSTPMLELPPKDLVENLLTSTPKDSERDVPHFAGMSEDSRYEHGYENIRDTKSWVNVAIMARSSTEEVKRAETQVFKKSDYLEHKVMAEKVKKAKISDVRYSRGGLGSFKRRRLDRNAILKIWPKWEDFRRAWAVSRNARMKNHSNYRKGKTKSRNRMFNRAISADQIENSSESKLEWDQIKEGKYGYYTLLEVPETSEVTSDPAREVLYPLYTSGNRAYRREFDKHLSRHEDPLKCLPRAMQWKKCEFLQSPGQKGSCSWSKEFNDPAMDPAVLLSLICSKRKEVVAARKQVMCEVQSRGCTDDLLKTLQDIGKRSRSRKRVKSRLRTEILNEVVSLNVHGLFTGKDRDDGKCDMLKNFCNNHNHL
jgi:hypothetical protein